MKTQTTTVYGHKVATVTGESVDGVFYEDARTAFAVRDERRAKGENVFVMTTTVQRCARRAGAPRSAAS